MASSSSAAARGKRGRRPSATLRRCASADAWSGWAKMVRTIRGNGLTRPGDRVGRRGVEIRDSRARPKVDEVKTAPIRSWPRVGGAGMSTSVVRPRPLVFCLDCGSGYDGMSTRELTDYWGCPPARITRWCRCRLLPATLTTHGWRIQPGARRPWMDGPMALQWRRTTRSGMTRVEQESLVSRMTASTAATVHSWRPLSQITVISRQMAFLLGTRGPIR